MTEGEAREVAAIITEALMTYQPVRGLDHNRLARAHHITRTLEQHGWHLMKDN